MLLRSSYLNKLYVTVVSFSSILQLGDSRIVNGFSRAIAVQREEEIDYGNEGNFADYSIFTQPLLEPPIDETILYRSHYLKPIIKVNNLNVTAFSSSSILHVGNSEHISMEARVKHIRQLLPRTGEQNRLNDHTVP